MEIKVFGYKYTTIFTVLYVLYEASICNQTGIGFAINVTRKSKFYFFQFQLQRMKSPCFSNLFPTTISIHVSKTTLSATYLQQEHDLEFKISASRLGSAAPKTSMLSEKSPEKSKSHLQVAADRKCRHRRKKLTATACSID